jgi:TctA family transporter
VDPLTLLLATLLFTLLGAIIGAGTGLVPGMHVNNVALLILVGQSALSSAVLFLFGWASPSFSDIMLLLSTLILAIAVSHTFVSFVPSVFLGAPDEDTALSVLPGHRMLLRGRGYEAVLLTARGCLWGFVASLALILPLRLLMGSPVDAYDKLRPVMAGVLALVVTLLIYSEGERRKATGRMMIKAHEVGGVQLLAESDRGREVEPWPKFAAGDDVTIEGRVAKVWNGGMLLVRGREKTVVETQDDWEKDDVWVSIQGIALPVTRTVTANEQRSWAVLLFLLSGSLGWVLLCSPGIQAANWYPIQFLSSANQSMMLFPLFSGLFGLSTMVMSGASRKTIPDQQLELKTKMESWRHGRAVACGTIAGSAVSWFPGVSGASATVIARYLAGGEPDGRKNRDNDREFLVSIGAANASSTVFTLVALFVIFKGRSGATATIGTLLAGGLSPWEPISSVPLAMPLLLVACLLSAMFGYTMAKAIARLFARKCGKLRYGKLVRGVVVFLLLMILMLTGVLGLFVAGAATAIGVLPPIIGVRRVHLMGSLILPAILLLAF